MSEPGSSFGQRHTVQSRLMGMTFIFPDRISAFYSGGDPPRLTLRASTDVIRKP